MNDEIKKQNNQEQNEDENVQYIDVKAKHMKLKDHDIYYIYWGNKVILTRIDDKEMEANLAFNTKGRMKKELIKFFMKEDNNGN